MNRIDLEKINEQNKRSFPEMKRADGFSTKRIYEEITKVFDEQAENNER
jgi:hypothetical protein